MAITIKKKQSACNINKPEGEHPADHTSNVVPFSPVKAGSEMTDAATPQPIGDEVDATATTDKLIDTKDYLPGIVDPDDDFRRRLGRSF